MAAVALFCVGCTNEFSLSFSVEAADAAETVVVSVSVGDAGVAERASTSATPSSTTSLSTSTTTLAPRPITLGFVGDIHMTGSLSTRSPLAAVTALLSAPDLMFANLETVVGDAGEVGRPPIDKEFIFRSPPETLDVIAEAGIDVVGMANNHSWDYGPTGARVTRRRVDDSPLIGVGTGPDPVTAYAPAFITVTNQVVGVVSLSRVPCDWAGDSRAQRLEIAWGCDRFAIVAIAAIATASEQADVTVVMLHGGTEVSKCPGPRLRNVIDVWIEVGADIVAISHPHVLQGVEMVNGAAVLWSTGNFVFGNRGGRTGRSAVFEVTISAVVEEIRLIPTVLPGGIAAPAGDDAAARVRAEVSERSVGGHIDDDGILVPDELPSICG